MSYHNRCIIMVEKGIELERRERVDIDAEKYKCVWEWVGFVDVQCRRKERVKVVRVCKKFEIGGCWS